jgi:hypothetical protein
MRRGVKPARTLSRKVLSTGRIISTQSMHAGLAESIAAGKVQEAEIAATEHQEVLTKILR